MTGVAIPLLSVSQKGKSLQMQATLRFGQYLAAI